MINAEVAHFSSQKIYFVYFNPHWKQRGMCAIHPIIRWLDDEEMNASAGSTLASTKRVTGVHKYYIENIPSLSIRSNSNHSSLFFLWLLSLKRSLSRLSQSAKNKVLNRLPCDYCRHWRCRRQPLYSCSICKLRHRATQFSPRQVVCWWNRRSFFEHCKLYSQMNFRLSFCSGAAFLTSVNINSDHSVAKHDSYCRSTQPRCHCCADAIWQRFSPPSLCLLRCR